MRVCVCENNQKHADLCSKDQFKIQEHIHSIGIKKIVHCNRYTDTKLLLKTIVNQNLIKVHVRVAYIFWQLFSR